MTSFIREAESQQGLTFEGTSRYAQVRDDMRLHYHDELNKLTIDFLGGGG